MHDNFFELGGDSILAIQVVARASQAGLRLSPRLLFQHQTVADLAQRRQPGTPGAGRAGTRPGRRAPDAHPALVLRAGPAAAPPLQPGPAARRAPPRRPPTSWDRPCTTWRRTTTPCGCASPAASDGWSATPRRAPRPPTVLGADRSICRSLPAEAAAGRPGAGRRPGAGQPRPGHGPLLRAVLFHLGAGQARSPAAGLPPPGRGRRLLAQSCWKTC